MVHELIPGVSYLEALRQLLESLPPGEEVVSIRFDTNTDVVLRGFVPPYVPEIRKGMAEWGVETIGADFITRRWRGFRDGVGFQLVLVGEEMHQHRMI